MRRHSATAEGLHPATLADVPGGATVNVCGRIDHADPEASVSIAVEAKVRVAPRETRSSVANRAALRVAFQHA